MNEQEKPADKVGERLIVALFERESGAEKAVRLLVERDFPMDMLSVLGKGESSGDDPLGIYYPDVGGRMKGWGAMGAFWGGVWGLLASAAGMFIIPGVGTVMAAGPIVEALVAALAGAGIAGGTMAGAAAVSHFTVAMHRSGVPEEKIEALQKAVSEGHYIVMLRLGTDEAEKWRIVLAHAGTESVEVYPYRGLLDMDA